MKAEDLLQEKPIISRDEAAEEGQKTEDSVKDPKSSQKERKKQGTAACGKTCLVRNDLCIQLLSKRVSRRTPRCLHILPHQQMQPTNATILTPSPMATMQRSKNFFKY